MTDPIAATRSMSIGRAIERWLETTQSPANDLARKLRITPQRLCDITKDRREFPIHMLGSLPTGLREDVARLWIAKRRGEEDMVLRLAGVKQS